MFEDNNNKLSHLIEEELNSEEKLLKPDFALKSGREILVKYLQTKFKQILEYDKQAKQPVFVEVRYNFLENFSQRLISNPDKKIMIGITGESASGKSTICRSISDVISHFGMPS